MANELQILVPYSASSVQAKILSGATTVATVVLSSTAFGMYVGSVPSLSAGTYTVVFLVDGVSVASDTLRWSGTAEITEQSTTELLKKIATGKTVTDPTTGTLKVYDTDDSTVLMTADLWEDAAGTTRFGPTSTGINRRDRLQ